MSSEQSAPITSPPGVPSPPATAKAPLPGWLLWFFLGGLGAHRLYFRKMGSGLGMAGLWLASLITSPLGFGFLGFLGLMVWWVYDAFQINKWARGDAWTSSSGFEAPAAGASAFPQVPAAPPSDIPSMSQPTSQSEAA